MTDSKADSSSKSENDKGLDTDFPDQVAPASGKNLGRVDIRNTPEENAKKEK